jgi:hypothetical protein
VTRLLPVVLLVGREVSALVRYSDLWMQLVLEGVISLLGVLQEDNCGRSFSLLVEI